MLIKPEFSSAFVKIRLKSDNAKNIDTHKKPQWVAAN